MKIEKYPVTTIQIAGKDRIKWLQGMVTNDVKQTIDKRSVECFVVDVKGKVLSHGWVFEARESLYFVTFGDDQAVRLLSHWDRYIIREDVLLSDVSSSWNWQFQDRADLFATTVAGGDPKTSPNMPGTLLTLSEPNDASDFRIALTNEILGLEYLLIGECKSNETVADLVADPIPGSNESAASFHSMRVKHFLPLIGIDFDDKTLPQELDRDSRAISFKKGCYLGQETIARLDALGQVQKKLVRLRIETKTDKEISLDVESKFGPKVGEKLLLDDKEAGWITSLSNETPDTWHALGYVRRSAFPIGSKLIAHGLEATVVSQF